jgi:hypothetical protein
LGLLLIHAQTVALILNLSTGHVSPQYPVVYDDDFTMVDSLNLGSVPTNWPELCINRKELVTEVPFQLSQDWTQPAQSRCSMDWLTHTLESAPSNTANVFGLDDEQPAETHAVTSSKGVVPFYEGANY